jgi:hypothetical protein
VNATRANIYLILLDMSVSRLASKCIGPAVPELGRLELVFRLDFIFNAPDGPSIGSSLSSLDIIASRISSSCCFVGE